MIFAVDNVSCGYGSRRVLEDISVTVESGEILCLLGPNGVGKTTLFKTMLGFLPLMDGTITVDGESIAHWSQRRKARVMGYVPQVHTPPFPFSVIDVVIMGRTAHLSMTAAPGKEDTVKAEEALERLGISYLADRIYTEISGGERQMVLIARALAQEPRILIMDEPTANLDFGNQVRVLSQVYRLAEAGMAIIMTSHFPDHAFLCSSKVGLLERDRFTVGPADEVVTEETLRRTYGVDVHIVREEDPRFATLKSCVPVIDR